MTNAMQHIQVILDNMHTLQSGIENRHFLVWQVAQLKEASELSLILFKLAANSLSWLKSGVMSSDVVNSNSLNRILEEGKSIYPNMQFPIAEIPRNTIADVVSLFEIQNLGNNRFCIKIPLVKVKSYKIYNLIPYPSDKTQTH